MEVVVLSLPFIFPLDYLPQQFSGLLLIIYANIPDYFYLIPPSVPELCSIPILGIIYCSLILDYQKTNPVSQI